MANMSYCRFTNTLEDLQDCYDNMSDVDEDGEEISDFEKKARKQLIALCGQIAAEYGDDE